MKPVSDCPEEFAAAAGGIPDSLTPDIVNSVSHIDDCGAICANRTDCCRFDWSLTREMCKLEVQCESVSEPFGDWVYCAKEGKLAHLWVQCL